jgi:DNA repair exonuclease SbcCD ATPase subunit
MLVKVASIGLLSIFLAACGIVDTEQAQEAIDLKTQVLEIKTTQIDPLMDEIDILSQQINPLEREIEELEQQRENLYDQGRELGNEFEKEMKKRFSSLFEADEDARQAFEEEFEDEFKVLQKQMKDLEAEKDDRQAEVTKQVQPLYEALEKAGKAKEAEAEAAEQEIQDRLDIVEEKQKALKAEQNARSKINNELKLASMALEEERMAVNDELTPLRDQRKELQRSMQDDGGTEQLAIPYREQRTEKRDQIRAIQTQVKSTWEEAKDVQWGQREKLRNQANADHETNLEAINTLRADSYAEADANDVAAGATEQLEILETQFEQNRAGYLTQLEAVNAEIEQLSAANTDSSGDSGSERSAIIASLESNRSDLETANSTLADTPKILTAESTKNPAYDGAVTARDAAQTALDAAMNTLNGTPEKIVGISAPDQPVTEVDNPNYAAAKTAVDEAQATLDAAESNLTNTPENMAGSESPNPAYGELQDLIANLEAVVADYETQLANAGEATGSNSELTAAYIKKSEYESILKEIENTYISDKQALQEKVNSGSKQVNVTNVENQIQKQIRDAENELRQKLKQIDNDSYGGREKPESVVALENQAELLEAELREIENKEQTAHKDREDRRNEIRKQVRDIEDLIDPLEDRQRGINLEGRPIRKQQMALEKERILVQPLDEEIKEESDAVREELNEFTKKSKKEVGKFKNEAKKEVEKQQEEIKKKAQEEGRGIRDQIQQEKQALDEQRDQLDDEFRKERKAKQADLEGQTDQLREEKFQPLETQAKELDADIESKWGDLSVLYEQQSALTAQLKELQVTVRDLDRQAEFGVLNVISGALENAEELEKQGGIGSFDAFLPDLSGGSGE